MCLYMAGINPCAALSALRLTVLPSTLTRLQGHAGIREHVDAYSGTTSTWSHLTCKVHAAHLGYARSQLTFAATIYDLFNTQQLYI